MADSIADQELKAEGFTPEQITRINHAVLTASKRAEGDPLQTVVVDGDVIYVRVAIPDTMGPVHQWRVIKADDGAANEFLAAPTVPGTVVYQPAAPSSAAAATGRREG